MLSLTENLSKLESMKITGFTDNSNFVKRDYAFISLSKNPKGALKYSKDAIDKGAKIVISQVNLHEHLKDKNLFDSNLVNHKDKYLEILFARSKKSIKIVGNYRYKWKIFNRIFSSPTFIFQGFQCNSINEYTRSFKS